MPQNDGTHTLKRMEFVFKGATFKFTLNPEEYTQNEVSRSTVTQTKGGAWIDSFGSGLPTIFMKGSTGFKGGTGVAKFKELRSMIRNYINNGTPGSKVKDELVFHNYTDEESWVVHTDPNAFKLLRSKSNPLLYQYEINLICIRPATYPQAVTTYSAGGVGVTLGSPLSKTQIQQAVAKQELAYSQVVGALKFNPKLIPDNTITTIVKSVKVTPTGLVQGYSAPTVPAPSTPSDTVKATYTPQVSSLAVKTLNALQDGTVKTYSAVSNEGDLIESLTALNDSFIPSNVSTAIKSVLLDYYAIGLNSKDDAYADSIADTDLQRLVDNTRWVSEEVSKLSKPNYDFILTMRDMERAVKYILDSSVYNKDVSTSLEAIKKITG